MLSHAERARFRRAPLPSFTERRSTALQRAALAALIGALRGAAGISGTLCGGTSCGSRTGCAAVIGDRRAAATGVAPEARRVWLRIQHAPNHESQAGEPTPLTQEQTHLARF